MHKWTVGKLDSWKGEGWLGRFGISWVVGKLVRRYVFTNRLPPPDT